MEFYNCVQANIFCSFWQHVCFIHFRAFSEVFRLLVRLIGVVILKHIFISGDCRKLGLYLAPPELVISYRLFIFTLNSFKLKKSYVILSEIYNTRTNFRIYLINLDNSSQRSIHFLSTTLLKNKLYRRAIGM